MENFKKTFFFLTIFIAFIYTQSCTPPKSVTQSGKVTPKGHVKIGMDYSMNIPTHFVRSLYQNVDGIVKPLMNEDTIILNDQLVKLNQTALAYAIEPLGFGYNYYGRYGIYRGFDVGYKFASGTHTVDAMWQFMGSTGTINDPGEKKMCGSIGLQFSSKKYDLPGWKGLDNAQNVLGFEMRRKDFMIPLVFSVPFGPEETTGNFSFGLVYIHSFLNYGFKNNKIYDTLSSYNSTPIALPALNGKRSHAATGVFFNLKIGYKYVYFVPAFALYYQNYGNYTLLDGSTVNFKGFTYVPSMGVQINPSQIRADAKRRKKKAK